MSQLSNETEPPGCPDAGLDEDTYNVRIDKYAGYERMIVTLAAALLAQIATLAAGALKSSDPLFAQVAYTLIFMSAACLGLARFTFGKHASLLQRDLKECPDLGPRQIPTCKRPSDVARRVYHIGLALGGTAAVCILVGVWRPSPPSSSPGSEHATSTSTTASPTAAGTLSGVTMSAPSNQAAAPPNALLSSHTGH